MLHKKTKNLVKVSPRRTRWTERERESRSSKITLKVDCEGRVGGGSFLGGNRLIRALHVSPITGLARFRCGLMRLILLSVHMGNFSPVGRDEIQTQNQNGEHKLVSFSAVVALWILVTLIIRLICIPLKWKYIQDKITSFCSLYVVKAKLFGLKSFAGSRLPGLEYS